MNRISSLLAGYAQCERVARVMIEGGDECEVVGRWQGRDEGEVVIWGVAPELKFL
jgi:hypothetical protein